MELFKKRTKVPDITKAKLKGEFRHSMFQKPTICPHYIQSRGKNMLTLAIVAKILQPNTKRKLWIQKKKYMINAPSMMSM